MQLLQKPPLKLIVMYALAMAGGALLLEWLEIQFLLKRFSTEIYIIVLCCLFTALGVWLGYTLTARKRAPSTGINRAAQHYLGISERECDVLTLLSAGHSNREIAERLFISTNTVKTHLQKLYQKLDVARRGQAVEKARLLHLLP